MRKKLCKKVQIITDEHIKSVDEKVLSKEKETMQYEPIKSRSHYHGW